MSVFGARHLGARCFLLRAASLFLLVALLVVPVPVLPFGAGEATAVGTIYWVDVVAGSDSDPGTDAEPFKTLTKACSLAGSLDTIMVRPGTYSAGTGETFPLELDGASLMSTGGAAGTVIQGDGIHRIMSAEFHQEGDVISGLTFTNGAEGPGAALLLHLNVPTGPGEVRVEDNALANNSTETLNGAGLFVFASGEGEHNAVVQRNVFSGNDCGGAGGALWAQGITGLRIVDNTFTENSAYNGGGMALDVTDAEVEITGNSIRDNYARGNGAGIYLSHSGTGGYLVEDNEIQSNWADVDGGGIYAADGILDIVGTQIVDNGADEGAGTYVQDASVGAWNNLVDDNNSAKSGAAWFVAGTGGLTEINDTVVGNGGATTLDVTHAEPDALLHIVNSVYRNTFLNVTEVTNADTISYSCFRDSDVSDPANGNTIGSGVLFADPLLAGGGDRRLAPGSPCIDTADPAEAPATDFFGTARPYDGDGDGVAKPDMGFHEFRPVAVVQHDAAGVTFDRFVTGYNTAYSGGGYVYGKWTGTKLQARFTGDSIRWIGPKQPGYGKADVYVDGVKQATVDCYAPVAQATTSAVLWQSEPLIDGAHTLEIRLVGQKNAASSGYVVVLDRFEVEGTKPIGGGARHDEKTGTLAGPWIYGANSAYIAKGYNYSRYTNAAYTKTFTGTRVAWIGPRTGQYGRAKVYIDGVLQGTVVSQYGTMGWRERVWESKVLPYGPHTIKIVPTGTKDAASKSTNIVIDAIDMR